VREHAYWLWRTNYFWFFPFIWHLLGKSNHRRKISNFFKNLPKGGRGEILEDEALWFFPSPWHLECLITEERSFIFFSLSKGGQRLWRIGISNFYSLLESLFTRRTISFCSISLLGDLRLWRTEISNFSLPLESLITEARSLIFSYLFRRTENMEDSDL
jgi:hypothetical protein